MKPVKNDLPTFNKIFPIGTRLRWFTARTGIVSSEILTVAEYARCRERYCSDCDGMGFKATDGLLRCHYRKPESTYGLCFWIEDK